MPLKTSESSTNQDKKFDSNSNNDQVPSKENGENQAQKSNLDGMYGIGGNLQTNDEERSSSMKFLETNHFDKVAEEAANKEKKEEL